MHFTLRSKGESKFRWRKKFTFLPVEVSRNEDGSLNYVWFGFYEFRYAPDGSDAWYEHRAIGSEKVLGFSVPDEN